MPRNNDRGSSSNSNTRRAPKDTGRRIKKKPCAICKDRIEWVDYKDVNMLRKYMSDRGKIRARRVSGNCAQHQRDIALAIKTARELVLLPYTQRTTTERPGGRGGRGRDRDGGGGYGGGQGRGRPRSDSDDTQGTLAAVAAATDEVAFAAPVEEVVIEAVEGNDSVAGNGASEAPGAEPEAAVASGPAVSAEGEA
jgi:small subunit ribosomal protein S18